MCNLLPKKSLSFLNPNVFSVTGPKRFPWVYWKDSNINLLNFPYNTNAPAYQVINCQLFSPPKLNNQTMCHFERLSCVLLNVARKSRPVPVVLSVVTVPRWRPLLYARLSFSQKQLPLLPNRPPKVLQALLRPDASNIGNAERMSGGLKE